MELKKNDIDHKLSVLEEGFIPYEKQEDYEKLLIQKVIKTSATEKFHLLMNLMKVGEMMSKAKIHHKPQQ